MILDTMGLGLQLHNVRNHEKLIKSIDLHAFSKMFIKQVNKVNCFTWFLKVYHYTSEQYQLIYNVFAISR